MAQAKAKTQAKHEAKGPAGKARAVKSRFGDIPASAAKIKTIGVLTGGGDCPGLNGVIRAVVKTAVNVYGWKLVGFEDGFEGLILPGKDAPLDLDTVRGILPRGGTILGSTNRGNPFSFPVETRGKITPRDCSAEVQETYQRLGLDGLIVIGGDGTLSIALRLAREKGLRCVGVPKTIDNDLNATDVTFGFDTAVATATEAIDKLHTTAESHHRVMFVEVMGRDAGWIALYAGLAGSAHAILIPEIPYDIAKLVRKIRQRETMGRKSSIVVVAEGAKSRDGDVSYVRSANPPFDLVRLGGAAQQVAEQIEQLTGKETRVTVLGHIQRGGSPTAFDRILATRLGTAAVHALARDEVNTMVALRGNTVTLVPMEEAVEKKKYVNPESEIVRAARAVGVDFCSAEDGKPA